MPELKSIATILCLLMFSLNAICQNKHPDSLLVIHTTIEDNISRVNLLLQKGSGANIDSNIYFIKEALEISDSINYNKGSIHARRLLGNCYRQQSNFVKAIDFGIKALQLAESSKDTLSMLDCLESLWLAYVNINDVKELFDIVHMKQMVVQSGFLERNRLERRSFENANANELSRAFIMTGKMDSARYYRYIALNLAGEEGDGVALYGLGDTYIKDDPDSAIFYYKKAIPLLNSGNRKDLVGNVYYGLSQIFMARKSKDSAMYYARKSLPFATDTIAGYMLMHKLFDQEQNGDSAYKYLLKASLLKDALFGVEKVKAIQLLNIKEQARKEKEAREYVEEQKLVANKFKIYGLLFVIVAIFSFLILLIRNNTQKGKANHLLRKQKEEINLQKVKVESAFSELRSTQAQLIQSEKMASLGELTAGIAHEIQNPLNFVNNFSDLSNELIDDMNEELEKGDVVEAKLIASDIKQNLQKINHHGKRAESIVTGMLQHSRISSGQKEPTDINKLADEYLRLAYHGIRAKDKDFNCELVTEFDNTIGNINIIPQDISRVILNLISNAFYAINEKNKTALQDYKPFISVSTKTSADKIELSVVDNGSGIPKNIIDKIFNPFFTTKPTGQGTGLGLSLSYDIVKAHGGELKVETKEGEGTTFIIQLPVL